MKKKKKRRKENAFLIITKFSAFPPNIQPQCHKPSYSVLFVTTSLSQLSPPECDRAATSAGRGGGGGREGAGGADVLYTACPAASSRLPHPGSVSRFQGAQRLTKFIYVKGWGCIKLCTCNLTLRSLIL